MPLNVGKLLHASKFAFHPLLWVPDFDLLNVFYEPLWSLLRLVIDTEQSTLSSYVILNKVLKLSKPYLNHLKDLSNTLVFIRLQRCIGIGRSRRHWFLDIHRQSAGFTMKNVCHWNKIDSAEFFCRQIHGNVEGLGMASTGQFIVRFHKFIAELVSSHGSLHMGHSGGMAVPRSWKEASSHVPLLSIPVLPLLLIQSMSLTNCFIT